MQHRSTQQTHPYAVHPCGPCWPLHWSLTLIFLCPCLIALHSFVSIGYTAAAKMFSSTTRVCPSTTNGQIAGFLNPVLASCQLVHVARPGEEPDVWEAEEDMRLLSPELADKNGEHRAGTTQPRHVASTRHVLLQQHKPSMWLQGENTSIKARRWGVAASDGFGVCQKVCADADQLGRTSSSPVVVM